MVMQPWKLATLAIGIGLLIAGSYYEQQADWDIGISIIMAVLTYLTAPFTCRTIIKLNWRAMPVAAFLAWLSIDGSYCLYNELLRHAYAREANVIASTPLYFMMGLVWMWNGSLKELTSAILASSPAKHHEPQR